MDEAEQRLRGISLDDLENKLLRAGGDINAITGLPGSFETRNAYHEDRQMENVDMRAPDRQPAAKEPDHYASSPNFSSFAHAVIGKKVVAISSQAFFSYPFAFSLPLPLLHFP